jgi:hypothetical protein
LRCRDLGVQLWFLIGISGNELSRSERLWSLLYVPVNVGKSGRNYASGIALRFPPEWLYRVKITPLGQLLRRDALLKFRDGTAKMGR